MPILVWKPGSGSTFAKLHGRVQEMRTKDGRQYTFAPGQGTYVEKTDVASVTSKLTAIDSTSTVTTPGAFNR